MDSRIHDQAGLFIIVHGQKMADYVVMVEKRTRPEGSTCHILSKSGDHPMVCSTPSPASQLPSALTSSMRPLSPGPVAPDSPTECSKEKVGGARLHHKELSPEGIKVGSVLPSCRLASPQIFRYLP